MRIPAIEGVIDRRILVNYHVTPDVLARLLPAPFRPQIVGGFGIAGVCLIRLKQLRPRFLPAVFGVTSENAAHRIAVEWEDGGETRVGVYVPRRDTSSRLNAWAGGRLFPGVHHHARFDVNETDDRYRVALTSDDGVTRITVDGRPTESLPPDSVFASLADASAFFEQGALGYSPSARPWRYDGLELESLAWAVTPLAVAEVESSFFADANYFPPGSAAFDCALLMRGIHHRWHGRETLCCGP